MAAVAVGSSSSDEKGVNKDLVQEFKVNKDNELRFEVESKERVKLELLDGIAEIFGTELIRTRSVQILIQHCFLLVFI